MKQLEHVASNLDTQSAEDEARFEAAKVAAAEVIDWFADDTDDANRLKAMIFGGRL